MVLKIFSVAAFLMMVVLLHVSAQQGRIIVTESDTTVYDVQDDAIEYQILAEFYKQTNGKRWKKKTNWLEGTSSEDMARWYGVIVRDGDISEIHLDANNLKGNVPKSLYKLVRLSSVSFEGNDLDGYQTAATKSDAMMSMSAEAESLNETSPPQPVTAGKNLPVWGLAVDGPSVQRLDWRKSPAEILSLTNSGISKPGAAGVAIDDCGELAFYVLHSGVDKPYQLHLYDATGVKLTTEGYGPNQALNSAHGNMELQVVRVPGKSDEWFIIYSLYQPPCLTSPPGSIYCPARVVYARVRYNSSGLYIFPNKREVSISSSTFTQGKAVSRTIDGQTTGHYLYLAERVASGTDRDFTRIHRYIIDESGINFGSTSVEKIPARYWVGTIPGSSIELSPDEKTLAISNRNVGEWINEDIILFDLSKFNTPGYLPKIISIPDLRMAETGMTVRQFYSVYPQYGCLRNMKNKLSFIEFSPSGRYLYAVHGGYPLNSGGVTYNSYLLQIDLQSATEGSDFTLRVQVQEGLGVVDGPSCTGSVANSTNNFTEQIQSAYDGKLYFTKRNSSTLFVIPNPDDPMPHDLEPHVIDLQPSGNLAMLNDAKVIYMPENIDGYNYLTGTANAGFTLDKQTARLGDPVILTLPQSPIAGYTFQVAWGDGILQNITSASISHSYNSKGSFAVTLTVVDDLGCASAASKTVEVIDCGAMEALPITATQYLCATKFSVPKISNCYATYHWDFGDGETSDVRSPIHVYQSDGVRHVTVDVNYNCGLCRDARTFSADIDIVRSPGALQDRTVQVLTDKKLQVIASGASTFSDSWPLDHNEPGLESLNKFVAGSKGVWRNEGVFLYNTTRKASQSVDLAVDGTYTLESFNWPLAHLEAIPKWIKTNTITRYNSSGYETENSDVLGISSAALYDYRGELQSAHGVNMRNDEMAFTGFEDPVQVSTNFIMKKPTGNFVFSAESVPAYIKYKVVSAESYVAVVNVPLAEIQDVEKVDIIGISTSVANPLMFRSNYLPDVNIVCRQQHPTVSDWSVLVFEKALYEGLWQGAIRIKNRVIPVVQGFIDQTRSHSGTASLKITSEQTFEQKLIHLEAGKTYHFNGWVTVSGNDVTLPKLSNNLGVDVVLRDKQGAVISTTFIVPAGNIIEGWQQLRGSFVCPEKDLTLNLKFKPGSTGQAWYDDIRCHPENGNMKTYVYNISDYRLQAILDEENFASFFYYDKEGNLYLTKKETEDGIKTITENISYTVEKQPE